MTIQEISVELRKKIYRPVYLLHGEEPYYIDLVTEFMIRNILTEQEKAFNQLILYGKDTDIVSLINTAKKYPMMASHQVVIVKEAQLIKELDKLTVYAGNPNKSTILVVNYKYGKYDKRKKLIKAIEDGKGAVVESPRLYENKIPGWIETWLKRRNRSIDPEAAMLLTEYLGNDLGKIENELEKLLIAQSDNDKRITALSIERNIGISKDYNNFELQKALGRKDVLKANRIINYFARNPGNNPVTPTITSLFFYFSRILTYHFTENKSRENIASAIRVSRYFVSEYEHAARNYDKRKTAMIISWLREYDMRSKGFGNLSADNGELLKELVYKILH